MKHIELFNIKFSQIRIFLSVVEFGGFTAAAEKLHITQPMISKTVAHLEEELGLRLILRGSRTFQVTPAGMKLFETWRDIMQNFEDSVISAHAIEEGKTVQLRVGTGALDPKDNPIVRNLRKMKTIMPGIAIYGESKEMSALIADLARDNLDMIVISKHMLPMLEGLDIEWNVLIPSRLCVYVHQSNPLFEREYITFSDLKNERFIVFSPEKDGSYMILLKELAEKAGFTPQISCYIQNEKSFAMNLELENGVALVDSYTDLQSPTIKKYPLDVRNDIIAVWKKNRDCEAIRVFISLFDVE